MFNRLLFVLLLLPALSFAETFVSGQDYQTLPAKQETSNTSKASVVEFFSYGCHWCYTLESPLNTWLKNKGDTVHFERVPVVFNKSWEYYAKAYYTAEILSMTDKLSPILFKAIQVDKQSLDSNALMVAFLVNQGVDKKIVESAFENSSTMDIKIKNGYSKMAQDQVKAVPAFIINDKYKTDLNMAKTPERLFKLLDYLLEK